MTTDAPQPGTPLPWKLGEHFPERFHDANGREVGRGYGLPNAEYLVYAANHVADRVRLLEMLKRVLTETRGGAVVALTAMQDARALLAELKEGSE